MARKKRNASELSDDLDRLGRHLRDLALQVYVVHNQHHDRPEWRELRDWSLPAWRVIAGSLLAAGWKPPME